jgi:putative membrane protein
MHYGGWMWAWGLPVMLLCVTFLVAAVWFTVRATGATRRPGQAGNAVERARGILAERYASGEISTEDYEQHLAKLG